MGKQKNLVSSMIQIGMMGFGGGNALIPVIEKKAVEEEALITQSEYEEDVVIASITPGALPVELAGGIGKRVAGKWGMLIGAALMAFPGAIFTVMLLSSMTRLDDKMLQQVEFLAVGITAFIACLLTDYIVGTVKACSQQNIAWKGISIILGVFVLTCGKNLFRILGVAREPFFGLATISIFAMAFFVILYTNCRFSVCKVLVSATLCGLYVLTAGKSKIIDNETAGTAIKCFMLILALYGLQKSFKQKNKVERVPIKEILSEIGVLSLFVGVTLAVALFVTEQSLMYVRKGILSSVMSFGGGDAYLTVADGLFVNGGLITEDDFYGLLVPIVNILPGSILCKTLSGIGYYVGYGQTGSLLGGYLVAGAGFAASIAASCGVFSVVGGIYKSFHNLDVFRSMKRWIRPIVAGLMLTVMLSLVYQNCKLGNEIGKPWIAVGYMAVIYAVDLILYYKCKIKNGTIALLSAVMSFALCNLWLL